jgi:hypothetical protein
VPAAAEKWAGTVIIEDDPVTGGAKCEGPERNLRAFRSFTGT